MSLPFARKPAGTGQLHWVGGPTLTTGQGDKTGNKTALFLHKLDLSRKKEIRDLDTKDCQSKETE